MTLRYALIGDGPSDDVLLYPIQWTIRQLRPSIIIGEPTFVARRHRPPGDVIAEVRLIHDPQLIIVHRDAERGTADARRREIPDVDGVLPIIPVRMTEAWLLIDEQAIRTAVSRPRGSESLDLPRPSALERRPDPKADLEQALYRAAGSPSGRSKKRLEQQLPSLKRRVAEAVSSFAPLLELPAFQAWQRDLSAALGRIP